MTNIAVLGFGTVGGGVVELIDANQDAIRKRLPDGLYVKYILDIRKFPDSPYGGRVVDDINRILEDPEVSVICETMGGIEPAFSFTKSALEHGISVCTSNKELVAARGTQLMEIARAHGASYLFEASVGGGIPILRPLRDSLAQEEITGITGILNGTTNYILTKMDQEDAPFDDVLKDAQAKGYAERNPEADIEGKDACRKIAILSSIVSGKSVRYEDIPCEGISAITKADHAFAKLAGCRIRLLGTYRKSGEAVFARIAPYLVPEDHPLYSVSGVFNGILIHGNMVDDVMFYGQGAGRYPTASAVVSDVMTLAAADGKCVSTEWSEEKLTLTNAEREKNTFFVRLPDSRLDAAKQLFGDTIVKTLGSLGGETGLILGPMTEEVFGTVIQALPEAAYLRML